MCRSMVGAGDCPSVFEITFIYKQIHWFLIRKFAIESPAMFSKWTGRLNFSLLLCVLKMGKKRNRKWNKGEGEKSTAEKDVFISKYCF